jgi:UDPglucose 6-dehydrogenase
VARDEAQRIYRHREDLVIYATADEAVEDADALTVATEWFELHSPDFEPLPNKLTARTRFDGRNIYKPETVRAAGLAYYSIGRRPITH